MIHSSLVTHVNVSKHKYPRIAKIDTISIHCMAGDISVERCGEIFQEDRVASSNYGIDSLGNIACYVPENFRSACTSSKSNDDRAITIEVANNGGAPSWPISGAAYQALIKLLVDICDRNNIPELLWKGDKSLIGKVSEQNMTVHRWFAAKACPGDYLYGLHPAIVKEVNGRLTSNGGGNMNGKDIVSTLDEYLKTQPGSDYAVSAGTRAVKKGVFADVNKDGILDNPKGLVTREQLAVILDRLGLLN